jgi:hypothetical protein
MLRLLLLACLIAGSSLPLATAEKKDDAKGTPAWMEAGKADARAAFAKQAANAPKPAATPQIVGEYLWSGRADDKYKPFFMFELRLRGGTAPLGGTQYRVVTLDPWRKPQTTGHWVDLGTLASGAVRDLSYKLNCPTFNAFQVEISWKDGKETYLAWDKVAMLPVPLGELTGMPFLVSLNQNWEHDPAKRSAAVSYMLWNIGGQPAKDVVQTVSFKDDAGKTIHTHEFKPQKGEVPAGYVGEQKLTVPKVPPFALIGIATKSTDLATLDPGSFTGAAEVEIAKVRAEGNTLKARVRNGTGSPIAGLVVTIGLTDRNGKMVKSLDLPVGDLAEGGERDLSADITAVPVWSGYEVSWRSSGDGAAPKPATPPSGGAQPQVLLVDGLEFTIVGTRSGKDGLHVSGTLRNRRDADLAGLVVSFTVPDGSKDGVVMTLKPGQLKTGDETAIEFTAGGVKTFTGLTFKWVSIKPAK